MDGLAYCAEQVRRFDSDRYVTVLFAPAACRTDLLALYAFNLEAARSREAVSEPMLGRIRLQWWRDAISECYEGRARKHQVVQPLAMAIERHGLSRKLFDRIIDAREADVETDPPEKVTDWIAYADATGGALNRLVLEILDVRDQELEQAAGSVGTGWALTGMLRGLRHLLLTGRAPLPADLMDRHGLSLADLKSLRGSPAVCKMVEESCGVARKFLEDSRDRAAGPAVPALLLAVLARGYLQRLAATGYDPFDERNLRPLRLRAWRLMIPALTGRI